MIISLFIHAVVTIFAIMNPIGNVPLFMSLTEDDTALEQRNTAKKAIIVSFFILTAFLLLGHAILHLFGITIDAFRIAGGILIFGIAYQLLHAKQSHMHTPHDNEQEETKTKPDISVTPLATPIIAGPGTIATIMALSANGNGIENTAIVFVAFSIVLIITYFIFYYLPWINAHLGKTELNVITRLMGLILAVIAVQMIVSGLTGLFPGWISHS